MNFENPILVTGGAGFIGSNFIHYILGLQPEARIVNLDRLSYSGSLENLKALPDPSHHTFVHGDIGDSTLVEDLLRQHRIETVIHFAAETHVDRSIASPQAFIEANVVGTFRLLEACRRTWLPLATNRVRFHHVSTDEVYGDIGPEEPASTERDAYRPNSPYAASKAGADHLVRAYARTYGLPVTISNCSNNYGPRQFPEKLIPLTILNALEGSPLPIYGDGRQIRDWVFVDDHSSALLRILEGGRPGETYHVGGGNQVSNIELVGQLCATLDELRPDSRHAPHSRLITHVADRPGHDRRYAMDITKIRSELGWQPARGLEQGLRETVRWYLNHADWLAAIRDRPTYREWLKENYTARQVLR
jgi:dTDP-glucose 4,6-dehydratase